MAGPPHGFRAPNRSLPEQRHNTGANNPTLQPIVPSPGTPGRTRTADTRFRKPLLYPLSYRGPYLECALWRARCKHLLNGKECSPHLVRYLRIAPPAQKGIAVPTTTRCGEKQSGHDTNVFRIHRDSHSRRLSAQSGRAPHRFQVRGTFRAASPQVFTQTSLTLASAHGLFDLHAVKERILRDDCVLARRHSCPDDDRVHAGAVFRQDVG